MDDDSFGSFLGSAGGASIAGGAVGAIGNVISAELQHKRQKKLIEMQQKYQTAEREATQRWQERMWALGLDHASPIAEMSRIRQAGLSPDLFYKGSSDFSTAAVPQGSASSAPSIPSPVGESSNLAAMEKVSNMAKNAVDVAKTKREGDRVGSLILKDGSEITLNIAKTEEAKSHSKQLQAAYDAAVKSIDEMTSRIADNYASAALKHSQQLINEQDLRESIQTFSERYRTLVLKNKFTESTTKLNDSTLEYYGEFMESTIENLNSTAFYQQQAGKQVQLNNNFTQKQQEAQARLSRKLGGSDTYIFDLMCELSTALLCHDEATVRKNLQLLQDFGTYRYIAEPVMTAVGIAAGAYIGRGKKSASNVPANPVTFQNAHPIIY